MKHGSLFSGIGGFELAAQMMGWSNEFHCEKEPFNQTVLKYYWPKSISYGDIKQTDFTIWKGRIDILTGGFPCQPYSQSGKRKGKDDDRHLWPEMLRAIREIKPRYIVGENVRGLINWSEGLVFDEVQTDLEAEGYEVLPFLLPASGVNAPHERYRIWFIAYSGCERIDAWRTKGKRKKKNTTFRTDLFEQTNRFSIFRTFTNSNGIRFRSKVNRVRESGFINQARQNNDWENFPTQSPVCGGNDGLPTELDRITVHSRKGSRNLNAKQTFSKWRNESLRSYGNAIVPQVVLQIFKAIEEYEHL